MSAAKGEAVSLKDKFYGCIAGAHVGAAIGAPVQGLNWQEIEAKHGTLDRLLPYDNGWAREAGTTESGVEQQKLLIAAITERQDRVTAEDVRAVWVRDARPESEKAFEPFDVGLLKVAKSGIPARDLGKYCDYAGLGSFAGYCHPVGLINAGDPKNAIRDAFELGQLYQGLEKLRGKVVRRYGRGGRGGDEARRDDRQRDRRFVHALRVFRCRGADRRLQVRLPPR